MSYIEIHIHKDYGVFHTYSGESEKYLKKLNLYPTKMIARVIGRECQVLDTLSATELREKLNDRETKE